MATTPERAIERIHENFGAHPGHRALHAKGIHTVGTFTATPEAAALTRAGHMSGATVPVKVRFSNGRGDPTVPDFVPDVRGMAVNFQLPDGTATDILAQTTPHFPFRDQEGVLDAMPLAERSLSSLLRLPLFIAKHPKALATVREAQAAINRRVSFVARDYFPFHAYKWVDAAGGERWIRYFWHPTVDEPEIPKEEAKRRGADYLFDELRERLAREPARMRLEVQIAGEGDNPHDPSDRWPDDRQRVTVGTLEVTAIDDNADDGIVFDPMRLVDGIEPSEDPALLYRPAVYSLSHAYRTGS
jgi:catalase